MASGTDFLLRIETRTPAVMLSNTYLDQFRSSRRGTEGHDNQLLESRDIVVGSGEESRVR